MQNYKMYTLERYRGRRKKSIKEFNPVLQSTKSSNNGQIKDRFKIIYISKNIPSRSVLSSSWYCKKEDRSRVI